MLTSATHPSGLRVHEGPTQQRILQGLRVQEGSSQQRILQGLRVHERPSQRRSVGADLRMLASLYPHQVT